MQQLNYFSDALKASTGFPHPRFEVPAPVVRRGDVTVQHNQIDHSVVGAVNYGAAGEINVTQHDLWRLISVH